MAAAYLRRTPETIFHQLAATPYTYFMVRGKGGVGKTSCAASFVLKFANIGHPTIIVSTDPAHSFSDSFDQDLMRGTLVPVQGVVSPLHALEINPEKTREELREGIMKSGGRGIKDVMDGMGLRPMFDQLGDPKLDELLDSPLPGLDESISISKLKRKLTSATAAIKSVFGQEAPQDASRVMAVSKPSRLCASLQKEDVPIRRLIVNQLLPSSATHCKFCAMKRKDQMRSLELIKKSHHLLVLRMIQAPRFDEEIRGVPALKFMGDAIWR